MKVRFLACGLLLLVASPIGAGDRLALRVSPVVSFAPTDLVVRATVELDAANRALDVVPDRVGPAGGRQPRASCGGRAQSALFGRAPGRATPAAAGSGVKSSPGLMKRSFSKRYCLS